MYGERCRLPTRRCGVAHGAIHRQIKRGMAGIEGLVVVKRMTGLAGIGRVGIIAVVAGITIIGDGLVRPSERVYRIVVKSGGYPGCFRVAGSTVQRELRSLVVGIGGGIVLRRMATGTGIGRIVVIAVVADRTITGNTCVRSV